MPRRVLLIECPAHSFATCAAPTASCLMRPHPVLPLYLPALASASVPIPVFRPASSAQNKSGPVEKTGPLRLVVDRGFQIEVFFNFYWFFLCIYYNDLQIINKCNLP